MFAHVIRRGLYDMAAIFSSGNPPPGEEIRHQLDAVNVIAKKVWGDRGKSLSGRMYQCQRFLAPVIEFVHPVRSATYDGVPMEITGELDGLFTRHYKPEHYLLIGCADDRAYEIQDRYAQDVADLLGLMDKPYQSRGLVFLGRVYGCTAIPLLSMSSVSAMWGVCCSSFYKRQLSLVSMVSVYIKRPSNVDLSSIGGLSHSQNLWECGMSAATTSHLSADFLGQ